MGPKVMGHSNEGRVALDLSGAMAFPIAVVAVASTQKHPLVSTGLLVFVRTRALGGKPDALVLRQHTPVAAEVRRRRVGSVPPLVLRDRTNTAAALPGMG